LIASIFSLVERVLSWTALTGLTFLVVAAATVVAAALGSLVVVAAVVRGLSRVVTGSVVDVVGKREENGEAAVGGGGGTRDPKVPAAGNAVVGDSILPSPGGKDGGAGGAIPNGSVILPASPKYWYGIGSKKEAPGMLGLNEDTLEWPKVGVLP